MFTTTKGYPKFLVESLLKKAKATHDAEEAETTSEITTEDSEEDTTNEQTLMMKVPYANRTVENLVESLKKTLKSKGWW